MAKGILFIIYILYLVSFSFANNNNNYSMCERNRTVLEATGDAAIIVFADTNYGPNCNISSSKGYEEATTALYVIETLNKYNYIPGVKFGLKIRDTCQDKVLVYKESLMITVEQDCTPYYELGILIPEIYRKTLEPLEQFNLVPIASYKDENFSKPLINIMVNFLATKYQTIDLFLTNFQDILNYFLEISQNIGICLKSYNKKFENLEHSTNNTFTIIAIAGNKNEIQNWIKNGQKIIPNKIKWIVLPTDGSDVHDYVPSGSYIIKTEQFALDLIEEFSSADDTFLQRAGKSVVHSPYLLSIGKSIIEIANSIQELEKNNCSNGGKCVLQRFDIKKKSPLTHTEVYNALHIQPKSHFIKYVITMIKNHNEDDDEEEEEEIITTYKINPITNKVTTDSNESKISKLCVKKNANDCEKCLNFIEKIGIRGNARTLDDRSILKTGICVPILLTIIGCGTFACAMIIIFIIYRYIVEEVLDGNPTLTIILILSTIFMLQSIIPFCINEEIIGSEYLNSRKILVTTLSVGFTFSIMLSRALFLAFSVGGIFTTHINGYLQGLMVFFVSSVQITISAMYFLLNKDDSAKIIRSYTFVALLSYDIFILIKLFIVCCFIAQIQRNYREGKCFFGTVIGLLIVWAVWITCFILVDIDNRDNVVSFGVIASAYLIILGILIPRTYYMVTRLGHEKNFTSRYDNDDYCNDPRINPIAQQSRQALYDYTFPATTGIGTQGIVNLPTLAYHPNYYGYSVSPNIRSNMNRARSPNTNRQRPGYNNYGYNSEMREVENLHTVPRVCVEDTECRPSPAGRSSKELNIDRPKRFREPRIVMEDRDCIETDIYVEGRLSPNLRGPNEPYPSRCSSPRLGLTESSIREEDEDDMPRITKF